MTGAVCGICTPAVNVISSDGLVIDNALPPGSSREGQEAGVDRMSPGMSKWLNRAVSVVEEWLRAKGVV